MHDDKESRLSEWYGTQPDAVPGGHGHRPEDPSSLSSQIPPRRSSGPSPSYYEPYWSEDNQGPGHSRKKHTGARVFGVCMLAIIVIAASALLFSNGGGMFSPAVRATPSADEYRSMQEFFDKYYDNASTSEWNSSIPRAETGTGVTLPLTPRPTDLELSLSEVYSQCINSTVAITAVVDKGRYFWGSGIIMTSDGYILTNSHVLDGAESATVTLWDEREFPAELVGADSASDIAVLKIDASGLPAAEFCSGDLTVGEPVAAIGNPLGRELRGTMTDGIVSAISRDITYTDHPMTLIQTNAAINEGNSGGPLLNMQGQVVGMTSMKLISSYSNSSIEGIGFAIPIGTMKSVADQLIENGRVLGRPALGITVGPIPSEALSYFEIPSGLYVTSVEEGSDAEAKGVQRSDIITAVNGEKVFVTADLSNIIDRLGIGDSVKLNIYRDGQNFEVDVKLMEFSELY